MSVFDVYGDTPLENTISIVNSFSVKGGILCSLARTSSSLLYTSRAWLHVIKEIPLNVSLAI